MTRFRALAALVMGSVLCGWGVGPARGQERLVVGDKGEWTHVEAVEPDWTDVDPDAGNEIPFDMPPRVTAGAVDPDCNAIGGFFLTLTGQNRYRANIFRVTANARLNEIQMELSFDARVNFVASVHRRPTVNTGQPYELVRSVPIGQKDGDGAASAPIFVSTGRLAVLDQVPLEAGYDYAIGLAWGAANMVYARDSVAHPVPFEIGRVLGSVAVNGLIGEPPTVPNSFASLSIFTGGSYSMLLCLEPEPGACCDSVEQSCLTKLEADCTGAGSYFRGERTTCAETVCNFGACCGPCGTCDDGVAAGACDARVAAVAWSGVSCPTPETLLCPVTTGACCSTNGTCTETCQALCNGTFRGVGTSCEPNICKGACCISSSGCSERTQTSCVQFQGQFRGLGTTCDTLPPNLQCRIGGACCYGEAALTFCVNVAQREFCSFDAFPVTAYRGDGTTCATSTCGTISGYRACCLPDGTCVNLNATVPGPDTCTAVGVHGEYNASVRCEDFPNGCPSESACCLPNGTCDTLTTAGCNAKEGSRPGTLTCGVNSCPTGACCDSNDGSCVIETQAACVANAGNYRGNATDCDPLAGICPGYGSCCREDGECFDDETAARCGIIGGEYQNDGSTCGAPTVDCDERGACCASTGTCLFVTAAECGQVVGVFRGAGVGCAANSCPTGACCSGESCAIRTALGCEAEPGRFFSDVTSCSPNVCALGSCCFSDNSCASNIERDCSAAGGEFAGGGNACEGNPCVPGACCSPAGECSLVREHVCAVEGGSFFGASTECIPGACDVGACCKEGQCIAAQTRLACIRDNGIFLGDGSTCVANACVPGACCDGVSCTNDIRTACENAQGAFRGAGTSCADVTPLPCPCTTGLQCDDGVDCTIDTCNGGNGRCVHTPNPVSCDNGILCDGVEICDLVLDCQPGPAEDCDDAIACTLDTCNATTDECENVFEATACDDGQFCNGVETCTPEGVCLAGTARDCSVVTACTDLAALAGLVECIGGPGVPMSSECACLNLHDDKVDVIDLRDVAAYQLRGVGP